MAASLPVGKVFLVHTQTRKEHTMRSLKIGTLALAGTVTAGLMAVPMAASVAFANDDAVKRDEDTPDVVMALDDDDDDDGNTNTGTNTGNTNTGTGTSSGDQNDATNSRVTNVTRDNDLSRSDLTRDVTNDGPGDNNRDGSRHHTNDASRNDTRG